MDFNYLSSFLAVIGLFVAVAATPTARADEAADTATARDIAGRAQDALESGDAAQAHELFARAYSMVPAPALALGIARADMLLGRWVSAHETYVKIVREGAGPNAPQAARTAVAAAEAELAALKPRLPGLILNVRGVEGASVSLNGQVYPEGAIGVRRFVDPGKHTVRASAPGAKPVESTFEITDAETKTVTLELVLELTTTPDEPKAPPPKRVLEQPDSGLSPMQIAGITIGSIGAATLIGSAVTGGLYWSARDTVEEECTLELTCSAAGLDATRRADALGLANTVTLFSGIGLAGLGTTLAVVGSLSSPPNEALMVFPGPGLGLSLGGRL